MLETPHVIVGAAIASQVANPWLALPLAFASHFVLERVPHWNPHLTSEIKKYGKPTKQTTVIVITDVVVSLVAGFFIASRVLPNVSHAITIILACFFAALPDIIEGPYYFLGIKSKITTRWIAFQKSLQVDASFFPGVATQIITIIAAFWWILN